MVECELCVFDYLSCYIFVLIDTWWNVNVLPKTFAKIFDECFNRYMVECECKMHPHQPFLLARFNRYMVECEFVKQVTAPIDAIVF